MPINDSVRASQEGLDNIIDPKRIKKGWNKQASIWADEARVSVSLLKKFWQRKPTRKEYFQAICQAVGVDDWESIVDPNPPQYDDWGDAPDVSTFFGRQDEDAILRQWIINDRCRLVGIVGIGGIGKTHVSIKLGKGGIGKTDLSVKLARGVREDFEYVIWRSLINAPPITELLPDLLQFLSRQKKHNLRDTIDRQISDLLKHLKNHRCLIILDNLESILEGGTYAGQYKQGYEDYGQFLKKIGEVKHESCLLFTSREKILKLQRLEGKNRPFRCLELRGLDLDAAKEIFGDIGDFSGSEAAWKKLIEYYNGNPLALELAAHHIEREFAGNLADFLQTGKAVFADIRELLDLHFQRFSDREKEIVLWLAIHREPMTIAELQDNLVTVDAQEKVGENLRSLQSKLPLEKSDGGKQFSLQPMLIEYLTDLLIDRVYNEIIGGEIDIFNSHALIQAEAKDYVREAQIRTLVRPITARLTEGFNSQEKLEKHWQKLILKLRRDSPNKPGYAGGNIINFLNHAKINLKGYNFSGLAISQAYLQNVNLHDVNFSYCDLSKSVFPQAFGGVHSLAFSPDSTILAVGDSHGEIHLLRTTDLQQVGVLQKHGWWVVSLAFSPDGKKLASSSIDGTLKLWNLETRECLYDLKKHTNWIWTVAFSPDGRTVASGSNDNTINLWDANTGECLKTLTGHNGWVLSVAFSPDGKLLVSGSYDKSIKLWNVETGACVRTLLGHTDAIWSVAFRPDGESIASCGFDKDIRLWNVEGGKCEDILTGHEKEIKVLAFSSDGETLVSASFEPLVKFWNLETGECFATGRGHKTGIRALAFSADGKTVASGDNDQILKIWNAQTGKCVRTLHGHTHWIWSVSYSPAKCKGENEIIASAHLDHRVRLWNVSTGECLKSLSGHTAWIWSVDFSADGGMVASSGDDETIRLWDVTRGECIKVLRYQEETYQGGIWTVAFSPDDRFLASGGQSATVKLWELKAGNYRLLEGHGNWVWTVAFSPKGELLGSGGDDQTIKIWNVSEGECLQTLEGHEGNVRAIAFSPDGKLLVSGSDDRTVKLWELDGGKCLATFDEHRDVVWSVKFSSNGKFIVSSSQDTTLKVWEVASKQCLRTFREHSDRVMSVGISPGSDIIISGSLDGRIKCWNLKSDRSWQTLKVPGPCEGMKIAETRGLTVAGKYLLQNLGAVE